MSASAPGMVHQSKYCPVDNNLFYSSIYSFQDVSLRNRNPPPFFLLDLERKVSFQVTGGYLSLEPSIKNCYPWKSHLVPLMKVSCPNGRQKESG